MNNVATLVCLLLIFIIDYLAAMVIYKIGKLYSIYPILTLAFLMIGIVSNVIIVFSDNETVIMICESVYYIMVLLEFFMFYKLFASYIYSSSELRTSELVLRGLVVVDLLILITNVLTKWVFSIEKLSFYYGPKFLDVGILVENHEAAYFHYIVCFCITLGFIIPSIKRAITSKGIYKIRYIAILVVFCIFESVFAFNFYLDLPVPVIAFTNSLLVGVESECI